MENWLNVRCKQVHCSLEYLIREADGAQDMTRAGLLRRMLIAAEPVSDWMPTYTMLSGLKIEKNVEKDVPEFKSWQAKYGSEEAALLGKVRQTMFDSLKEGGVVARVLQTQFMLQLLMMNYICHLRQAKLSIKEDKMIDEEITLPEMSAIFTEMILTDRDCEALRNIRKILVDWRNNA